MYLWTCNDRRNKPLPAPCTERDCIKMLPLIHRTKEYCSLSRISSKRTYCQTLDETHKHISSSLFDFIFFHELSLVSYTTLSILETNSLFRPRLPQTRSTHRIPTYIILASMVPRIPLLMRLRRTYSAMCVVAGLVQLACCRVDTAALGLGDGAVVGAACAVFDGRAGEFGSYGFVDAGVGCWDMLVVDREVGICMRMGTGEGEMDAVGELRGKTYW